MVLRAADGEDSLKVHNRHVCDEELVLGTGKYKDQLGMSTLERCRLSVHRPQGVMVFRCRFVRCELQPKKEMAVTWDDCAWEDCVFHGTYPGMGFGQPSDVNGPTPWGQIAVRGCDFTAATMHGCIFKRTDVDSMKFPGWPCFTILRPQVNRAPFLSLTLPVPRWELEGWIDENDVYDAVVFHWPTVVKNHEQRNKKYPAIANPAVVDADPEEVRRVLASADFIRV